MLSSLIRAAHPEFLAGRIENGDVITEALLGTLVSVLNQDKIHSPLNPREAYLLKAKDFFSKHFNDPALCPLNIAKANHISLRYLHNIFKDSKESVQSFIISKRLEKALRLSKHYDEGAHCHRYRLWLEIPVFRAFFSAL